MYIFRAVKRMPRVRRVPGRLKMGANTGSKKLTPEMASVINTSIIGGSALCLSYMVLESIRLSKPGSEEERVTLRKVRKTAEATAAGATEGVIGVTGSPSSLMGSIVNFFNSWFSPSEVKSSNETKNS